MTDYSNVNWALVNIGNPETDWNNKTWVNVSDENGDFYLEVDSLEKAAMANEQTYVIDGDNQTYLISPEEAKTILNKIK